jgi:hypothetical protein
MPPSGFSEEAVDGLRLFLSGCLADLQDEVAAGKHASLRDGVDYEIAQIEKALSGADRGDLPGDDVRGALLLVQQIYKDARESLARGQTVEHAVAACVERIGRLHITPEGKLTTQ